MDRLTQTITPVDHATEKLLVAKAQKGNKDALRVIIQNHQQRLYAFLWRIVRDHHHAEELAQETFVRAIEHLHTFKSEYRFSTWLFTIGYRLALNSKRKKKAIASDDAILTATPALDDTPEDSVASSEAAAAIKDKLWAAVEQLSLPQKTSIYLYYREGFSCEQVAEVLHCPVDTVKSHLHRARARLRDALAEPAANLFVISG